MPEKILIAQHDLQGRRQLNEILRRAGYFVLESDDLDQAVRRIQENPSILLLDAGLLAEAQGGDLVDELCRCRDVFCLAFSSQEGMAVPEVVPWAKDVIRNPGDEHEVVSKVASSLTIRRLGYELNLAQSMLEKKKREFEENLHAAGQVQKNLLPVQLPHLHEMRFAYRFLPCEAIGGDLFNILRIDERTVMAYLFDVSGHGVSSAMVSVSVHQSLSPHTGRIVKRMTNEPPYYEIPSPAEVVQRLEQEYPFERFEKFFTIVYLLIDLPTGRVRYCNAGHPAPALLRSEGHLELLNAGSGLVGLNLDDAVSEGDEVLRPGDRLFLYSDGITEYVDGGSGMYGEDRLFRRLAEVRRRDLDSACGKIIDSLYAFGRGAPPRDDVTLLAMEFRGGSA